MTAKIIADSICNGSRITTMEVVMHRFVLAEFNTHRRFGRNSASSRAIPVTKMLKKVKEDPAFPAVWASEFPGMQGGESLVGDDLYDAQLLFRNVHKQTLIQIEDYLAHHPETRLHKSLLNRLLEPFMWHTVIVTSTEWENFFKQRCSPLAQPEIRIAAEAMRNALKDSIPQNLMEEHWHLPFIQPDEDFDWLDAVRISVARCARVSYLTHDGKRDPDKDLELFERLKTADPPHWSPMEHVAQPYVDMEAYSCYNLNGWASLRYQLDKGWIGV